MRLSKLEIIEGGEIIRSVEFRAGLNLILDSPTSATTHSGNNVGKTTVLRLIDFCLGSDGQDIWQDPEFPANINRDVYDFLHDDRDVWICLHVSKSVNHRHELRRSLSGKKPRFSVDGAQCRNITLYREAVRTLLFGSPAAKPSLRQLAPKFVRSSPALMSRTLKYMGDYTSDADYESIHLFLFGFFDFEVLEERPRLMKEEKKLTRDLEALQRNRKEGEIEQLLLHLRSEILAISQSPQLSGEIPEIAKRADAVTAIRARAAKVAGDLARVEGELSTVELSMRELSQDYTTTDQQAVEAIYREAGKYLPKLHHDWNELTAFVGSLRSRKQRYLQDHAKELQSGVALLRQTLSELQRSEANEIQSLSVSKEFQRGLEIRADLEEKLKRLGSLEQDLKDIGEVKQRRSACKHQIRESEKRLAEGRSQLSDRVRIFNSHFSKLSEQLYNEKYLLHFEENARGTTVFALSAVGSNVGAGKKASQTAAFDVAYIEFLRDTGISFPKFVCHDGVESIHGNQLGVLLRLAAGLDGQLVIATLRDKLPDMPEGFVEQHTVLELSEQDRLFRI